jgi:hypothetical protein
MGRLESIHLENNRLTGPVPASLKQAHENGAEIFFTDNYMTGEDLSSMPNNAQNFADGAQSIQYDLTLPGAVRLTAESRYNIYANLRNIPIHGAAPYKALLPASAYGYRVLNDPQGKLTVTRDGNGIYATLAASAALGEGITVELYIIGNEGSEFSTAGTVVTTDNISAGGSAGGGGFPDGEEEDIPQGETPLSDVHAAYISGYPGGAFMPDKSVSREEVAKMMTVLPGARLSGVANYHISYPDVDRDRWSAEYILNAAENGYFEGYPDGNFRPSEAITRAEFTAVLVRASGVTALPNVNPKDLPFTDIKDAWYLPYLAAAFEKGYTEGYPDGSFRPDAPVSRAEAVKMLNLFCGRDPAPEPLLSLLENPFNDVSESHWAYPHIIEAGVTHEHVTETGTGTGTAEGGESE